MRGKFCPRSKADAEQSRRHGGGEKEVLELRLPRTGWNYKDCGRQGVRMVVGLDNNFKR